MTDDDWVREALTDAVQDVEPGPALDLIRSRTGHLKRRRGWAWGTAGAAIGIAATVTAVAVLAAPGKDSSRDKVATTQVAATAYFVSNTPRGPLLFPETVEVAADDPVRDTLLLALSGKATDPDYGSPFASFHASVTRAVLENDQIVIDLAAPASIADLPEGVTSEQAGIGVEQLVCTAQDALQASLGTKSLRRTPVQFLVGGKPAYSLLGVNVGEPIAAEPRSKTVADVSIRQPLDGATIPDGYLLKGYAAAFEGNVQYVLRQGDKVVAHGFATTTGGMGVYSEYAVPLAHVPPGQYTLLAHGDDPSAGEGGPLVQDDKQITIE